MSIRRVLTWPDARLTQRSAEVSDEEFGSEELHALAQDLVDTMAAHEAAGLAAVQIGVLRRVIALAYFGDRPEVEGGRIVGTPLVICNPRIAQRVGSVIAHDANQKRLRDAGDARARRLDPRLLLEGCLSFPGVTERIDAPMMVVLEGRAVDGTAVTLPFKGTAARAADHETDHCDGRTMLDRLGAARRRDFLRRYSQARTLRKAG